MSRNRNGRQGGLIGAAIKGGGFVVGLGTELRAHNKALKAKQQQQQQSSSSQHPQTSKHDRDLEFDDDSPPAYNQSMSAETSLDSKPRLELERSMAIRDVNDSIEIFPLPYPVILPQRRPNDKKRGFIRAYAPDLGTCKGINEATFLHFLKDFHKSSQASPWFTVINIAAMGAGLAPSAIATAVSMSVSMAATAGAEAHGRHRTNAYLDKVNKELFHPKNLHCMIMTWKPDAIGNPVLDMEFDEKSSALGREVSALSQMRSSSSGMSASSGMSSPKLGGGKFRVSDGVTQGEWALPQAARLIYPSAEEAETSREIDENGFPVEKKEGYWKSTGKFLADYQDRRAQAKFAATYGHDSKLAVPGAADSVKFASKYSDPNVNILDFMSGGDRSQSSMGQSSQTDGRGRKGDRDQGRGGRGGLLGGVKGMLMQSNLLYLLIAEIPREQESMDMLQ